MVSSNGLHPSPPRWPAASSSTLSASVLLALHGRIAGISGIVGGLFERGTKGEWLARRLSWASSQRRTRSPSWRVRRSHPTLGSRPASAHHRVRRPGQVGTQLGNGCTSGHGVCGISRLSKRSIVATATFMAVAVISTFVVEHVLLRGHREGRRHAPVRGGRGRAIFAFGLRLSGMTNPAKVIGFLDVAGAWDPSLAFVMAGAIGAHFLVALVEDGRGSLLGGDFVLPELGGDRSPAPRGRNLVRSQVGRVGLLSGPGHRGRSEPRRRPTSFS